MAKVRMKRIEIISLLTDGKSIIERLQRRGVVDLLQYEIPDDQNGIEKIDTSPSIQLFERNSAAVRQALAILNEYSPEKQSIMASFEPRTAISTAEFGEMAEKTEMSIRTANEIIKLNQKINENKASLKARIQYAESLEAWSLRCRPVCRHLTDRRLYRNPDRPMGQRALNRISEARSGYRYTRRGRDCIFFP